MDWIDIPQAPPAQERHNQCLGLNATTWSVDFHQRRWPTAQPPALGMAWYARSLTDAVSVTTMPHHGMAHQHTGSPQCYILPRIAYVALSGEAEEETDRQTAAYSRITYSIID